MPLSSALRVLSAVGLARAYDVASRAEVGSEFASFIQKFDKTYDSDSEKETRFEAFLENYRFIQAENAKGHSYELGLNHFADMTLEEFTMTRLGLRAPPGQRWGSLPKLGTHEYSNESLAKSVDWTTKGAVTAIKNQGSCGSCWAFSTTGALEGAWQISTGKLAPISEQQFVDCAKKFGEEGCNGGLMDNAFKYSEQAALCTEESYPYKAMAGICKAKKCQAAIPKGGIVGYKDVKSGDTKALMSAVAQQPVSIAIEADKPVFQMYRRGVLAGPQCGTQLDHGVLLVGYGTDAGKKYWKVKNSWGPSWGESGYIRLSRDAKGKGECGIESQPSYPVVKAANSLQLADSEPQTFFPSSLSLSLSQLAHSSQEELVV